MPVIKNNLINYICANKLCANPGFWNNKEIVLELDHINGKNMDNRLENLQFLCPNCHSTTLTFSGKNNFNKRNNTNNEKKTNIAIPLLAYEKEIIKNISKFKTINDIFKFIGIKAHGRYYNSINKLFLKYNDNQDVIAFLKKIKNNKIKINVSTEKLFEEYKYYKNFTFLGKKYNCSANAIKKRFKRAKLI